MRTTPLPSSEYLNDILHYDPETGVLTWKVRPGLAHLAGKRAGCERAHSWQPDYISRVIRIDYHLYAEHRIIWKMVTGRDPVGVDHINGDATVNAWSNLREANHSQNMQNGRARGRWPKGVCFDKSRGLFAAKIKVAGKTHNLGRFSSPEKAAAAYALAADFMFGEFASVRGPK